MSLTYAQARDEILTLLKAAWDPTTYPMLWEDVVGAKPSDGPYGAVFIRHAGGGGHTLGTPGNRRFTRQGTIFVQVHVPRGRGFALADQLSKIAADAYEGQASPGGVWFRDVRVNEVPGQAGWYQVNVLVEFSYDEQK